MRKVELTDPDDIKYAHQMANLVGVTLDEPVTESAYRDMLDVEWKVCLSHIEYHYGDYPMAKDVLSLARAIINRAYIGWQVQNGYLDLDD